MRGDAAKRALDVVASAVGLLVLAPVLLLVAILVRLDSPGPAFYEQTRVGLHGKPFRLLKFRTMHVGADRTGRLTTEEDPRVTRIGAFLRRAHLDELPQLFNVLAGDMSIVGPRPEVPEFVDLADPRWRKTLSVRPGLTAPVTLHHLSEGVVLARYADPAVGYRNEILPRKLDENVHYVETRSFFGDLLVVVETLLAIARGAGEDESAATRARRAARLAFFVVGDAVLVVASVWAALALRYDGAIPPEDLAALRTVVLVAVPATLVLLRLFGAYRVSWSFVGLGEIARIAAAVLVASLVLGGAVQMLQASRVGFSFPRSVAIIQGPLTFLSISAFRLSKRAYMALRRPRGTGAFDRALLVGGGDTGAAVLRSINSGSATLAVAGFLDDDPLARGTTIHGVKVLGPVAELEMHVRRLGVGTVVLCVPSASGPFIRDVVQRCRAAGVRNIRIVPPLREVIDGRASWKMTRDVRLEDLLGRDTVEVIHEDLDRVVRGRRVVVTGGAGTIGSELCRQILRLGPAKLYPLDIDETRLHDLGEELRAIRQDVPVEETLVDVRDRGDVERFFRAARPDLVFHAAAYKHVPMMERWPVAALHTNVVGTSNVLEAAAAAGVREFVLVSTDKAVEPSSVMGATKRLAEVVTFGRDPPPGMACAAVRFGNVIGSRGSVIPTFERQLRRGGPITVTHPDIERYFMMTSEAVLLVLHAAAMAKGRDVFVLDMGRPVRILDVAREFVRLNGMEPDKDIPIVFTGLRPGEKLTEILHYPEERLGPTRHPRIARAEAPPLGDARQLLAEVAPIVAAGDTAAALRMLRKRFPTLVFDAPKAS